jgi:hypothetical protein
MLDVAQGSNLDNHCRRARYTHRGAPPCPTKNYAELLQMICAYILKLLMILFDIIRVRVLAHGASHHHLPTFDGPDRHVRTNGKDPPK